MMMAALAVMATAAFAQDDLVKDAKKLYDKGELEEVQWSVGAEYTYNDKFTVRAGYHHESESQGNRKYFTFGAGFRMSVFSIDAGYVWSTAASNPLDQTLRVSLAFDFDGIRDLFRGRR